jgi:hypothetical protein
MLTNRDFKNIAKKNNSMNFFLTATGFLNFANTQQANHS